MGLLYHSTQLQIHSAPNFSQAPQPAGQFAVVLQTQSANTNSKSETRQPHQHTAQAATKPETQASIKPVTELHQASVSAATTSGAVHRVSVATINHDMLSYLQSEFRLRFHYPRLAVKRGWQGQVIIGMQVHPSGVIDNIAIQQSSGYPLLDQNAMHTFRSIGTVTRQLQQRLTESHAISIPVIYQLTGG